MIDLDFTLSPPEAGEAWKIFADNIMDKDIDYRRSIGSKDEVDLVAMTDAWVKARDQFMSVKHADVTQEEHDYLKMFLTGDPISPGGVIPWIGSIKEQLLTAFQGGKQ